MADPFLQFFNESKNENLKPLNNDFNSLNKDKEKNNNSKFLFTFLIENAQNLANEGISNLTISQKNEIINKLRSFASLGIKEEIIKDLIKL